MRLIDISSTDVETLIEDLPDLPMTVSVTASNSSGEGIPSKMIPARYSEKLPPSIIAIGGQITATEGDGIQMLCPVAAVTRLWSHE